MSFLLKTESFSLLLNLRVFESDIRYPLNTIMEVEVESNGFAGNI